MQRVDLSGAKLFDADFSGADLSYANLSSVNLAPPDGEVDDFASVRFDHATFVEANCEKANFIECSFVGAEFASANLVKAIFCGSDFMRADIRDSDCTGADFEKADLRGTNLTGSKFNDANFNGILFDEETDWNGVTGLDAVKNVPDALSSDTAPVDPSASLRTHRAHTGTAWHSNALPSHAS